MHLLATYCIYVCNRFINSVLVYDFFFLFFLVPGAATITDVTIVSNSIVNITWREPDKPNGPLDIIRYQIKANSLPPSPASPLKKSEFPNKILSWSLNGLQSGSDYEFRVQ